MDVGELPNNVEILVLLCVFSLQLYFNYAESGVLIECQLTGNESCPT